LLSKGDVLRHIVQNKLSPVRRDAFPIPSQAQVQPKTQPQAQSQAQPQVQTPKPQAIQRKPEFQDIPPTTMRQVIAKRLTQSKGSTPHTYAMQDIAIDGLLQLRKQLNESNKSKLSVNDFIIKATALALERVPAANVLWNSKTSEVELQKKIDVSVAIAIQDGLITPIIFGANNQGLLAINQSVKTLQEKAKKGTLKPEEYQGGTFTISNLGMFGISNFTAVINPPQASILSVGGSRQELSLDDATGTVVVNNVMSVTLNFDARAIDSDTAGEFLTQFANLMRNPIALSL